MRTCLLLTECELLSAAVHTCVYVCVQLINGRRQVVQIRDIPLHHESPSCIQQVTREQLASMARSATVSARELKTKLSIVDKLSPSRLRVSCQACQNVLLAHAMSRA